MIKQFGTFILFLILSAFPLMAQAPQQRPSMGQVVQSERLDRTVNQNLKQPLTQGEVINLVKKNKNAPDFVYKALD
jgi:hypothetical protein